MLSFAVSSGVVVSLSDCGLAGNGATISRASVPFFANTAVLVNVPATVVTGVVHTNFWLAPTAIAGALARAGVHVNAPVAPAKLSSVTVYEVNGT